MAGCAEQGAELKDAQAASERGAEARYGRREAATGVGEHFSPNTSIALAINGHLLGSVDSDSAGAWAILLSTDQADVGYYTVTAQANGVAATATFRLDGAAPLRAKAGNGPVFAVPAGAAFGNIMYLPFIDADY